MASTTPAAIRARLTVHRDPHPARMATFAEDVRAGLGRRPMALSPMWFYDDLGSALFEAITRLPEYYLTRVERDLLATYGREIVERFDGRIELLELGSGSATKTKLLIEAILERQGTLRFHPVDISTDALVESSTAIVGEHPGLNVVAHAGDYFSLLRGRQIVTAGRTLAIYLGSNIGNFEPARAAELLGLLSASLRPGDGLLIGYDLRKDRSILEPAYDDPTGVTAAFNKNLLARMNRELGADFDLSAWRHRAHYAETDGVVRSHLVALRDQRVTVPSSGLELEIAEGETIHTESSYKFTPEHMGAFLESQGFAPKHAWTDAAQRYALTLAEVTDVRSR